MVITSKVQNQYFENEQHLIRIAQDNPVPNRPTKRSGTPWTSEEHDRFLHALEQYPSGPWKVIASCVGTRTTRQTMTHTQKYREKIARHKRSNEQCEALLRYDIKTEDGGMASVPHATAPAVDPRSSESTTEVYASESLFDFTADLDDLLFPHSEVDDMYDATIATLLESYEPLEIGVDDPFWQELEDLIGFHAL